MKITNVVLSSVSFIISSALLACSIVELINKDN